MGIVEDDSINAVACNQSASALREKITESSLKAHHCHHHLDHKRKDGSLVPGGRISP